MNAKFFLTVAAFLAATSMAHAAGRVEAGKELVTRSCTTCHTDNAATTGTDGVPPLSVLAKDNKDKPAWIRGWLMDPHPPMPSIMLSRQQVDDIVAYLGTLPMN